MDANNLPFTCRSFCCSTLGISGYYDKTLLLGLVGHCLCCMVFPVPIILLPLRALAIRFGNLDACTVFLGLGSGNLCQAVEQYCLATLACKTCGIPFSLANPPNLYIKTPEAPKPPSLDRIKRKPHPKAPRFKSSGSQGSNSVIRHLTRGLGFGDVSCKLRTKFRLGGTYRDNIGFWGDLLRGILQI